jgi:hypothetical protein
LKRWGGRQEGLNDARAAWELIGHWSGSDRPRFRGGILGDEHLGGVVWAGLLPGFTSRQVQGPGGDFRDTCRELRKPGDVPRHRDGLSPPLPLLQLRREELFEQSRMAIVRCAVEIAFDLGLPTGTQFVAKNRQALLRRQRRFSCDLQVFLRLGHCQAYTSTGSSRSDGSTLPVCRPEGKKKMKVSDDFSMPRWGSTARWNDATTRIAKGPSNASQVLLKQCVRMNSYWRARSDLSGA